MGEHSLKIMRRPFLDLQSGAKTGEVRSCADRDFQVGETVVLNLIDETGNPTGQSLRRSITHIQRGYGLPDDICVLSYAQPSNGALTNEGAEPVAQFAELTCHTSACVHGYTPGMNLVELLVMPGPLPQWLELGESVTIMANERAPEGWSHLGQAQHDAAKWESLYRNEHANCTRLLDTITGIRATTSQPTAICTCPSGDGSLRWPCPVHPPEVKALVLPERKRADPHNDVQAVDEYYEEFGWNACLDRVKELNS
jgi:hypothetical protein